MTINQCAPGCGLGRPGEGALCSAFKRENGKYLFHQPCGLWNEPCVHGCGYIHLSNLTPGTRKKCCVNGRLSSASDNFEEELMMGYVLDELPAFVRKTKATRVSQYGVTEET